MKKLVLAALAAVLAVSAAPTSGEAQQPIILKVHSFSSPQAPEAIHHMLPLIEKLNAESKGRLKLEFYPSMQLGGKASDLIQQLEDGVVDIVITLPGVTPGRFSGLEGMDLPFTNVGTAAGQTPALLAFANKWLMTNEFKGIKILHMHATDAATFHTRTKALMTLDDFKGQRIRAPGRFVGEAIKIFGGTPVGIPLGGVYEALERGQIDGMAINWAIMLPYKLQEVTKFNLETPVYQTPLLTLMSQASYDKLPADLKKLIDDNIGVAYSVGIAAKIDEITAGAKKATRERGNTLYSISDDEKKRWVAALAPVYKLWIDDMNKRGLPGQKMFDDILALTAQNGRK